MSTPIWIDCDTGIDDALALLFAAAAPDADVIGVSTVAGNCDLASATRNTLAVVDLAGLRVPVHPGAAGPICGSDPIPASIHGGDGLGGLAHTLPPGRAAAAERAPDAIRRACAARPGEVVVIATGPLTNLAAALAADPGFAATVRAVVAMGGAIAHPGNVTPVAEFNIASDPEAARAVLGAPWPVTLVPLDVTMQVRMGAPEVSLLRSAAPHGAAAEFCGRVLDRYMDAYQERLGRREAPMHDPLAVAVALDPTLVGADALPVGVETAGVLTRGMTVADRRARPDPDAERRRRTVRVCLSVDAQRACDRLITAWRGERSGPEGRSP